MTSLIIQTPENSIFLVPITLPGKSQFIKQINTLKSPMRSSKQTQRTFSSHLEIRRALEYLSHLYVPWVLVKEEIGFYPGKKRGSSPPEIQ